MGKQGPCYHCGVTSTPLWRNGPPDKPVLCNACGSRWRTKGTLANYTPLHARAEPDEFEDYRVSRVRNISTKNKEKKLIKRKLNDDIGVLGGVGPDFHQGMHKGIDDDNSNRSSSGSAMSNSDSCVHFSSADASDLTGPSQSIVWDTTIPSRKRTCVSRSKTSSSAVEKLTKDLYTILHEQQSSHYSGSCEEDLLFECDKPMVSVEIGHGSVLIRHPSYVPKEEESVASSPSIDNKLYRENEAYSRLNALPVYNKGVPILGIEKSRKTNGLGMQQEQTRREKSQRETLQNLENHNSPLCCVDLNDILNFDEFARVLTNEEQHKLFMYLHSTDTAKLPDSLKSMFASPQFKEDVSCFQKLLAEGVFDLSFSGVKAENCMTLKRLALCDSAKSDWVEQYNLLKEIKCKKNNEGSVVHGGPNIIPSGYSTNVKRSREGQFQRFPGVKSTIKSPKRMMKGSYEHKELIDNDGTCFSPKSLFMSPNNSSSMLDSFHYMDESSDQDMLLEVPSNGSFPEAELLLPTSNFGAQASTSSSSIHPQLIRP